MFPTIPTVAAGRIIFLNQLNTTATLTSPDLSTLTFDAGDTLIAIAGEYQSNAGADAAFTGWAGGGLTWTEIRDSTGTTNNRMGVAVTRSVSGSETGTVTVTRSGTLVGDASIMILAVPGGHASTNAEATVMASTATPPADPASLSPSWGASDTLWIAVGSSGCTAIAGTWTAMASAPTNYTDYQSTSPTDTSVIGDFGLAVAFRQLNAASEDTGTFTQDTSNARSAALTIAVRPAPAIITGIIVSDLGFAASATGTVPVAAISTFTDDFASADGAKWSGFSGDVAVSGGQLSITVLNSYPTLTSVNRYNLINDAVYVELVQPPNLGLGGTEAHMRVVGSTGYRVDLGYRSGNLFSRFFSTVTGDSDASEAWDAAYNFFRIRVDSAGSTVYFDTSPDGLSWTSRRNVTDALANWGSVEIKLYAGFFLAETDAGTAIFDNLNIAAAVTDTVMSPVVAPSRPVRSWR